jgi:hypothetical protein
MGLERHSIQYVRDGSATDAVLSSPPVPDWKGDGRGTTVGLSRAYEPVPAVDGPSDGGPAIAIQQPPQVSVLGFPSPSFNPHRP